MKKILLSTLATITLLVSGCEFTKDKKATEYTEYIEAAMDATYYGDSTKYVDVADTTVTEAKELYEHTIDYLAESIMLYNDVSIDYISEETYKKYQDLAKEALKKTKYTVNTAVKVDGIYQVKVEIEPLDIWESTYDEVEQYIGKFNEKYPDYESMTDEEVLAAEEEYAKATRAEAIRMRDELNKAIKGKEN